MEKAFKKNIEKKIVDTIDVLLSGYHTNAAREIRKSIKSAGKNLSKKFNKEIKKFEKDSIKGTKKKVAVKKPVISAKSRTSRVKKS